MHFHTRRLEIRAPGGEVAALAWTADSDRLLCAMKDGTIHSHRVQPQ